MIEADAVLMGCVLYIIIIYDPDMVYFIFDFVIVLSQYFLICHTGANMSHKFSSISTSLYLSKWYYLNVKDQKHLLMILMESQKATTLTVGGLAEVSLARFASVRFVFK